MGGNQKRDVDISCKILKERARAMANPIPTSFPERTYLPPLPFFPLLFSRSYSPTLAQPAPFRSTSHNLQAALTLGPYAGYGLQLLSRVMAPDAQQALIGNTRCESARKGSLSGIREARDVYLPFLLSSSPSHPFHLAHPSPQPAGCFKP